MCSMGFCTKNRFKLSNNKEFYFSTDLKLMYTTTAIYCLFIKGNSEGVLSQYVNDNFSSDITETDEKSSVSFMKY